MNGVIADESKILLLEVTLAATPFNSTNAKMGLSTTNITPDGATVLADLTAGELAVAGYARQTLTGWATPTLTSDFHAYSEATAVTFLNTSGAPTGTIYTWFFVDTGNGKLICSGRFGTPFILPATTGTYTVKPFMQGTSEF